MPVTPPLSGPKPRVRKEEGLIWGEETVSGKNTTIETNLTPKGNTMPKEIKPHLSACMLVWRYICMHA